MTLPSILERKNRLGAAFDLVSKMTPGSREQAFLTEYLCIRVSGFFEQAITLIFYEHSRQYSSGTFARFVSRRLRRTTNLKSERLCQLVGEFSEQWEKDLRAFLQEDHRSAMGSVVTNRNKIAHGDSVSLGLHGLKDWYGKILDVVEFIEEEVHGS